MQGRLIEAGQERSSGVSGGIFGKVMLRGFFFFFGGSFLGGGDNGALWWRGFDAGLLGGICMVRVSECFLSLFSLCKVCGFA